MNITCTSHRARSARTTEVVVENPTPHLLGIPTACFLREDVGEAVLRRGERCGGRRDMHHEQKSQKAILGIEPRTLALRVLRSAIELNGRLYLGARFFAFMKPGFVKPSRPSLFQSPPFRRATRPTHRARRPALGRSAPPVLAPFLGFYF